LATSAGGLKGSPLGGSNSSPPELTYPPSTVKSGQTSRRADERADEQLLLVCSGLSYSLPTRTYNDRSSRRADEQGKESRDEGQGKRVLRGFWRSSARLVVSRWYRLHLQTSKLCSSAARLPLELTYPPSTVKSAFRCTLLGLGGSALPVFAFMVWPSGLLAKVWRRSGSLKVWKPVGPVLGLDPAVDALGLLLPPRQRVPQAPRHGLPLSRVSGKPSSPASGCPSGIR
jgi:hypothetical protein